MDFKLISKNNVGTAVLLLLAIALSQSKAFNFLIDTALGRFFLIVFILCLSHCNKILGVVGVLFIIIMFNSNIYYEGFEDSSSSKPTSSSSSTDDSSNSTDASSNSTTTMNTDQIKEMIKQQISDASKNNTSSSSASSDTSSTSKNSKAAEGFDILGIENNIKRGKQSNSIPVNSFMRDSDSIFPYEGTSFLGSFSPF
jgi:ABC-type protease/lipase transport system fused ATPase/permease subunit